MSLTFRKSYGSDQTKIQQYIDADKDPGHKVKPDFWITQGQDTQDAKGSQRMVIDNGKGLVFFLRLDNVMQAYIQFPPEGSYDPMEMKEALKEAFLTVAANGRRLGYKKLIFDSVSESLIGFFKRKFKFEAIKETFGVGL